MFTPLSLILQLVLPVIEQVFAQDAAQGAAWLGQELNAFLSKHGFVATISPAQPAVLPAPTQPPAAPTS